MRCGQDLPTIFEPHRRWLFERLDDDVPKAWILKNDCWELQTTPQSRGLIEYFEHTLIQQQNIGIIQFSATIESSKEQYRIVYLYDGAQFSHTIFQPRHLSESFYSKEWWIERWCIEHVLSN